MLVRHCTSDSRSLAILLCFYLLRFGCRGSNLARGIWLVPLSALILHCSGTFRAAASAARSILAHPVRPDSTSVHPSVPVGVGEHSGRGLRRCGRVTGQPEHASPTRPPRTRPLRQWRGALRAMSRVLERNRPDHGCASLSLYSSIVSRITSNTTSPVPQFPPVGVRERSQEG